MRPVLHAMPTGYLRIFFLSSLLISHQLFAAGFVQVNGDFGGSNILADLPQNTELARLSSGQGVGVMLGSRWRIKSDGRAQWALKAAAGYKYQSAQPTSRSVVSWTRWPLELMVMSKSHVRPYSLGVGVQYHPGGRLAGTGSWESVDEKFAPGLGVIGSIDYPLSPEFSAGLRLGYISYRNISLNNSYSALTMGLGITYFYSE